MGKIKIIFCLLILGVFFQGTALAQGKGRGYFDFGVFALDDGDTATAEFNFQKALELEPGNLEYLQYLGRTYTRMGKFSKAKECFEKVYRNAPDLVGIRSDFGYALFRMEKYQDAAAMFQSIVRESPDNVEAAYFSGLCLFRMKNYETALPFFIRISEMSPNLAANAAYYKGVCRYHLGQTEKAAKDFAFARDHATSGETKKNAGKWMAAITKPENEKKSYSLFLKIGGLYDDNVRLDSDDEKTASDEDDFGLEAYLSGEFRSGGTNALSGGAGLDFYMIRYQDLDAYNLMGGTVRLFGEYLFFPLKFRMTYMPDYYYLDSDSYLRRHRLKPEIIWNVNEKFQLGFSYVYSDNKYFENPDRDGDAHEIDLDASYRLTENCLVFGKIGYDLNDASHADYDYTGISGSIGTELLLPWSLKVDLSLSYNGRNYDNEDSVFREKRSDDKFAVGGSVSRPIIGNLMEVDADFFFTTNDSNIGAYEYDRFFTGLFLIARF